MGVIFFIFWFHECKVTPNSSRTRLIGRTEKVAVRGVDTMGSHFSMDF